MKSIVLAVLMAATLMAADTPVGPSGTKVAIPLSSVVYVTARGKTYHTSRECMSVAKSTVLQTTAKLAEAHGLKLCGICARRGVSKAKTFDNSWAK